MCNRDGSQKSEVRIWPDLRNFRLHTSNFFLQAAFFSSLLPEPGTPNPQCGIRDETYAAMFTRSSSVSFATTGFINSVQTPCRAPACMSYIWRTM
jgi:hypothetical protein